MSMNPLQLHSDKKIIDCILSGDEEVINYFFFHQCDSMFRYIISCIFRGKVEREELINELFVLLQKDDWHKLKQFDHRSKLITWLNTVAVRYFIKNKERLIEKCNSNDSKQLDSGYRSEEVLIAGMDVKTILSMMPNERYREVIQLLVIEERPPQEVADMWGITVDNLYNIKRRALKQLEQILTKLNCDYE